MAYFVKKKLSIIYTGNESPDQPAYAYGFALFWKGICSERKDFAPQ